MCNLNLPPNPLKGKIGWLFIIIGSYKKKLETVMKVYFLF